MVIHNPYSITEIELICCFTLISLTFAVMITTKNYVKYILGFKKHTNETLNLKEVNLSSIIEESTILLFAVAHEKSISFELKIDSDLPNLKVDPEKIKQIFIGILIRAMRYSSPNQIISIEAIKQIKEGNPFLIITVQDKGFGLSEEMIDNLDKNLNIKRDHGEMHFSVMEGLMKLHNGSFSASTHPGKGSSINLVFPLPLCKNRHASCKTDICNVLQSAIDQDRAI